MTRVEKELSVVIIIALCSGVVFGAFMQRALTERVKEDHIAPSQAPDSPPKAITTPDNPITLDDLLDAIEQVESGGDVNAIGKAGEIGCMQIMKIMVDDVNRILGYKHLGYWDCWRRGESRQMCRVYMAHYCEGKSWEYMARCWNGGPDGYKKDSTLPYWEKVKAVLYE